MDDYELDAIKRIGDWLSQIDETIKEGFKTINITIGAYIAKMEALQPDLEYSKKAVIVKEKKGKYTWIVLDDGSKIRKCNNAPCPYYLKWNDEIKSYEHGKYDANSNTWTFVDDRCEFYT